MYIVVARHQESTLWLYEYCGREKVYATIYNDGDDLQECSYIQVVKGDRRPIETTKYIEFILQYYESLKLQPEQYVVFTQANPFDHSPDFIDLLEVSSEWEDVQTLTLYGIKPSKENSDFEPVVENPRFCHVKTFSNGARVWMDEMDHTYQGKNLPFEWWETYKTYVGNGYFPQLWALLQFEPCQPLWKAYAACFAVKSKHITKYPYSFWLHLYDWVIHGDNVTHGLAIKDRGIIMEYTWMILFKGSYIGNVA